MLGVVATRLGSLARQPWFLPLAICYTLLSAFVLSFAPRFWDLVPTVVLLVASVVLVWYLVALARPFRTGWNSIIAVGLLLPILALLVWHWTPIPALPWAWPKSLPLGASLGIPVFLALFAAASALAASVRQAAQAALIVGAAIFVC
ncbi:MAG TPA: hypothetical protein VHI93_09430, partial [Candidatus Thermoplasmatota archaeon]|nr:hypothetical protein [Candidatus Thermoplasmatota archaeon]